MVLVRSLCGLLLAGLCACPGDVPPREEAEDAPIAVPDSPGAADARTATPDAPGCTITGGVMGFCIDKTVCLSMPNHVATPGFCPGPANIQCCTQQ
jgi:hypothetical protein